MFPEVSRVQEKTELLQRSTRNQCIFWNPLFQNFSKNVLSLIWGIVRATPTDELHHPPNMSLKLANDIFWIVLDVFNDMINGFDSSVGKLPERRIEES